MGHVSAKTSPGTGLLILGYRKYFNLWVNLAKSITRSEDDARDVVHNVISGILNDPAREFESIAHVRNYVARAVINRAIQGKQRNEKSVEFTEDLESRMSKVPETLEEHQEEEMTMLKGGIRGLPRNDFEIIKLRFYAGLTFLEISELLNIPVSTLKSRETAALKRMRKWIRKNGY
jgi:RNA polymerase sigma factor (sigma-70 family)